jgi:hypothetical protein
MKKWSSGAFQFSAMLLVLLALIHWPALANDVQGRTMPQVQQTASEASTPAHLRWMLDQHWRAVNGQLR